MSKALYGHVGGPDPRMASEMRRLQQRVRDLEAELVRLQEVNDALATEPSTVNAEPEGKGWFFKLKLGNTADLGKLMTASAYETYVKGLD